MTYQSNNRFDPLTEEDKDEEAFVEETKKTINHEKK